LSRERESKPSDPWPYWSYMFSLSRSHTGLHALILLPMPHTFRIWVHTWLVMLSHAVLSVVQVFHPLWCWVWLLSLWECYGLPSIEMWGDRVRIDAMVWSMVGMVEMVNTIMVCGARIFRVDTPGQYVPLCVWYRTTCLLIRNATCCVSCSIEWALASYFVIHLNHMVQEGSFVGETISKHDILL
jgi:hypothetical protein